MYVVGIIIGEDDMPRILKHTDYAARIVLYIAGLGPGAHITISEIISQRLMPGPFVRRVVARLASTGILRTSRGSGGGVALGRPPSKISMFDVIQAMEGNIVLNRCVTHPDDCPFSDECPVRQTWMVISEGLEKALQKVTFESLLKKPLKPPAKTSRKPKES